MSLTKAIRFFCFYGIIKRDLLTLILITNAQIYLLDLTYCMYKCEILANELAYV